MIDLKHYTKTLLPTADADLFLKYFGKYKYSSLFHLKNDLESIKVNWIKDETIRNKIKDISINFANRVKDEQITFKDKLDHVMSFVNIAESFDFEWKRADSGGTCPSCGKKELYVPSQGEAGNIVCSRRENCTYSSSIYKYLKDYQNKSSMEALELLADFAEIDLKEFEHENEVHIFDNETTPKETKKKEFKKLKIVEKKETKYLEFDLERKFLTIDTKKYISKFDSMNDEQQWKMIITEVYNFSLQTNQNGKNSYYKNRGISAIKHPALLNKVKKISSEIGYLSNNDLPKLIDVLSSLFPINSLVKYGIIHDEKHKKPFTFIHQSQIGFCVIPNFDLYTDIVTAIKLRNVKLYEWQSSSMKEPEMSYRRIANPLPYGLTNENLRNFKKFGFFEGSVDSFSVESREGVCDIAIPGVSGINKESLGLFKDKDIEIWYDQDKAGQIAAYGSYKIRLKIPTISYDFIGESLLSELKRFDNNVNYEIINNNITFKEILIINNSDCDIKLKTLKTILERRKIEFTHFLSNGIKQNLLEAGAKSVVVKNWNILFGSDTNEALQNNRLLK